MTQAAPTDDKTQERVNRWLSETMAAQEWMEATEAIKSSLVTASPGHVRRALTPYAAFNGPTYLVR